MPEHEPNVAAGNVPLFYPSEHQGFTYCKSPLFFFLHWVSSTLLQFILLFLTYPSAFPLVTLILYLLKIKTFHIYMLKPYQIIFLR